MTWSYNVKRGWSITLRRITVRWRWLRLIWWFCIELVYQYLLIFELTHLTEMVYNISGALVVVLRLEEGTHNSVDLEVLAQDDHTDKVVPVSWKHQVSFHNHDMI